MSIKKRAPTELLLSVVREWGPTIVTTITLILAIYKTNIISTNTQDSDIKQLQTERTHRQRKNDTEGGRDTKRDIDRESHIVR